MKSMKMGEVQPTLLEVKELKINDLNLKRFEAREYEWHKFGSISILKIILDLHEVGSSLNSL